MITITINLKEIRKSKGLTTRKLERLSGVSCGYISLIETEQRMPTIDIICKLAKALRCKPEELYTCSECD